MNKVKILAVCAAGVGSSVLLNMTIKKVCEKHGIDVEVKHAGLDDAIDGYDVIVTSTAFADDILERAGDKIPLITITNYLSENEMEEKLKKVGIIK